MSRAAWLLLLAASGVRLLAVWLCWDLPLLLDEDDYHRRALYLLQNGHFPDAFRPPVYPTFIAAIYAVAGPVPGAVRLAQAALGVAAGALLYRWLWGHVGERGALLSLGAYAVYPTLAGFAHMVWSETVYLSLLLAFLVALFPADGRVRSGWAGLALGLGALTRSQLVPLAPLAAVGVALLTRSWQQALRFGAVVAVCLVAWAGHNLAVTGAPTVLEISNGYNLWKGNTPVVHPLSVEGPQIPMPLRPIPMFPYEGSEETLYGLCAEALGRPAGALTFPEVNDCARDLAVGYIAADPAGFVARGFEKLGYTFHPSSQLTRYLWVGHYGAVPGWAGMGLVYGTAASMVLALGAGLLGWVRMPQGALKWAIALLVAHQLAVVFVAFGNSRFRLPIVLLALVCVAWLPRRAPA